MPPRSPIYRSAPEVAELAQLGVIGTREQVLACLKLQQAARAASTDRSPHGQSEASTDRANLEFVAAAGPIGATSGPAVPAQPAPAPAAPKPAADPAKAAQRVAALLGTREEVLASLAIQSAVRSWRWRVLRSAAAATIQRAARARVRRVKAALARRAICAAVAARVMRTVLSRQAEDLSAASTAAMAAVAAGAAAAELEAAPAALSCRQESGASASSARLSAADEEPSATRRASTRIARMLPRTRAEVRDSTAASCTPFPTVEPQLFASSPQGLGGCAAPSHPASTDHG